MTALWTSAEAAEATGGNNTAPWQASGVSIDSRTVQAGDLFIAIKGPNLDGHAYVARAFAEGAVAAMVTEADNPTGPLLMVSDTTEGMAALARHARQRSTAKITAVTGSAGKTGTKDALALVLGRQGETAATSGNLNNHWGLAKSHRSRSSPDRKLPSSPMWNRPIWNSLNPRKESRTPRRRYSLAWTLTGRRY